jgi:hypothetical protein
MEGTMRKPSKDRVARLKGRKGKTWWPPKGPLAPCTAPTAHEATAWIPIDAAPLHTAGYVYSTEDGWGRRTDMVGTVQAYESGGRFVACSAHGWKFTHWHPLLAPPAGATPDRAADVYITVSPDGRIIEGQRRVIALHKAGVRYIRVDGAIFDLDAIAKNGAQP